MKKFIIKSIIFILLIILVDLSSGKILNFISTNAKSGGNLKNNHIAYNIKDDILIFGSSRAAHHYKPEILKDTLNMSCYNCGRDGNGIILMYGRYKLLTKRYNPKVIIYDVTSEFDLKNNDNIKYLADLKKYYNNQDIKDIFNTISQTESLKMSSKMYRNNSTVFNTLFNYFVINNNSNNGYLPIYKDIQIVPVQKTNENTKNIEYDKIKLYYLEKLIQDCKGNTELFFTVSPYFFRPTYTEQYAPIKELCAKYNIKFIEHDDSLFYKNKKLFSDTSHLNDKGATMYSSMFASIIKQYLFK